MSAEAARRRFDAMIARASHRSTPREEALTALEGARRVAARHDLPGSARRLEAVEVTLGLRERQPAAPPRTNRHGRIMPQGGAWEETNRKLREFSEALSKASGMKVTRQPDGTYKREPR